MQYKGAYAMQYPKSSLISQQLTDLSEKNLSEKTLGQTFCS